MKSNIFGHQFWPIEIDNIFEKLIKGSDSVFVLKMSANSESQLFLDHDIRGFLKLSGGTRSEDSSNFARGESTEVIEIADSVETIGMNDFNNCKSLKRIIFSSGNRLRKIVGFECCTSLCRIEIPPSLEIIGDSGFRGITTGRQRLAEIGDVTVQL
jgi:hypothetical protein